MLKKTRDLIVSATAWLPRLKGQGVLVRGGYVLTAAHCIGWTSTGGMVLGDVWIEQVRFGKQKLKLTPTFVEPVSDIAALGPLDSGGLASDYLHFGSRNTFQNCRQIFDRLAQATAIAFRIERAPNRGRFGILIPVVQQPCRNKNRCLRLTILDENDISRLAGRHPKENKKEKHYRQSGKDRGRIHGEAEHGKILLARPPPWPVFALFS